MERASGSLSISPRSEHRTGKRRLESRIVATFYQLEKIGESVDRDRTERKKRNHVFHEALIGGCTSKWLRRFYGVLYDQHKCYRNISYTTEIPHPRNIHQEHEELRNAAFARDTKWACAAIEHHIQRTAEITLRVLKVEMGRQEQEIA